MPTTCAVEEHSRTVLVHREQQRKKDLKIHQRGSKTFANLINTVLISILQMLVHKDTERMGYAIMGTL